MTSKEQHWSSTQWGQAERKESLYIALNCCPFTFVKLKRKLSEQIIDREKEDERFFSQFRTEDRTNLTMGLLRKL